MGEVERSLCSLVTVRILSTLGRCCNVAPLSTLDRDVTPRFVRLCDIVLAPASTLLRFPDFTILGLRLVFCDAVSVLSSQVFVSCCLENMNDSIHYQLFVVLEDHKESIYVNPTDN